MLLLQFPVEGMRISQHVTAPDAHHVAQQRERAFPETLASFAVAQSGNTDMDQVLSDCPSSTSHQPLALACWI